MRRISRQSFWRVSVGSQGVLMRVLSGLVGWSSARAGDDSLEHVSSLCSPVVEGGVRGVATRCDAGALSDWEFQAGAGGCSLR